MARLITKTFAGAAVGDQVYTFVVPPNVRRIRYRGWGGGGAGAGGGGASGADRGSCGGGGGAGAHYEEGTLDVIPGETLTITVGGKGVHSSGNNPSDNALPGGNGADSKITRSGPTDIAIMRGGEGGRPPMNLNSPFVTAVNLNNDESSPYPYYEFAAGGRPLRRAVTGTTDFDYQLSTAEKDAFMYDAPGAGGRGSSRGGGQGNTSSHGGYAAGRGGSQGSSSGVYNGGGGGGGGGGGPGGAGANGGGGGAANASGAGAAGTAGSSAAQGTGAGGGGGGAAGGSSSLTGTGGDGGDGGSGTVALEWLQ